MFQFLKGRKKTKELEEIILHLQTNLSNNYKDAAQLNLKEFEAALKQMEENGEIKEAKKEYYERKLEEFKAQMKNFTHKDQKPYWAK